MLVLVVARAVQGFGAGLNIVSLYVVVGRAFPAGLRPRVFSAISSGWILPSLVGPPVAGLLADHLSWRWVFLGVLPLLLGAALLVRPHLGGLDGPAAEAAGAATPRRSRLGARCWPRSVPGCYRSAASCSSGHPAPAVLLVLGRAGAARARRAAAAAGRRLPARAWPADGRGPAGSAGRGLLRDRDVHPADARRAAVAAHDPGRRLTDGRRADLVARRLAAGPAGVADAARGAGDSRLRLVLAGIGLVAVATSDTVPAVTAAVGWVVAGLGMGLGLTSLSVLVLELSPVAEQGANASALQVSDALGSIIMIGTAGAVFAALATGPAHGATPYLVIDAVMATVCVAGHGRAPGPARHALAQGHVLPTYPGTFRMSSGGVVSLVGPMSTTAASHLSPAFPLRAPWGTAEALRAWQQEALDAYLAATRARATSSRSPRPAPARRRSPSGWPAELLERRVVEARDRRRPHRAPQAPVGRRGQPGRHQPGPDVQQRPGRGGQRLHRRRGDLRPGRRAPACCTGGGPRPAAPW